MENIDDSSNARLNQLERKDAEREAREKMAEHF